MSEILHFFKGKGRANTLDMTNLREAFSNLVPPWGSISLSSTAVTTTSATPGDFVKCEGITQLNGPGYLTSMSDNNRIEYTGDSPRHFHIAVSVSFYKTGGGAADTIELALALNGTEQLETAVTRTVSNGTDVGSTAVHGDFMLSNGDYIELFIANDQSGSSSVTIDKMYMFMVGMMVL